VLAGVLLGIAPAQAATTTASDLLAELPTAPAVATGYERSLFPSWIDADGDGCDTRAEVLMRDSAVPTTHHGTCTIDTGSWTSWYDDQAYTNASDLQIDHVVPLEEAWASGARNWTTQTRQDYANDLSFQPHLQAVTAALNESKGDRDPATWMPPAADAQCRYVTDWVEIKYRWSLTVDQAERNALTTDLASGACGSRAIDLPTIASISTTTTPGTTRIAGSDRYGTSAAIAAQYSPGVPILYVASGRNFPDALSAAPAAAAAGGPLLLTDPENLPTATRDAIVRLEPASIVVVGGPVSVSDTVLGQLGRLAPTTRVAGADRYATSRAVVSAGFSTATTAIVATGANFPDALSASAAAGAKAEPVILVPGTASTVDSATLALLDQLGVQTVDIAGGTAVVAAGVESSLRAQFTVSRLAGADRYATSSAINRSVFGSAGSVYLASGANFPDALSGAALAGRNGAPLAVVPPTCFTNETLADVTALGATQRILLGGTSALGDDIATGTICPPPPVVTTPAPPSNPVPTKPANPGDTKNCTDFPTQKAAQAWFNTYYPYYGDVAGLDADHDGVACESLPAG
jgi:putative cell wall-binding protein